MHIAPVVPGHPSESKLAAALSLAERGFAVLPCRPNSKKPLTANGVDDATTDLAQIRAWWASTPDANPAYRIPENCVLIDLDPKNDPDAETQFLALGGTFAGWVVATPSGGRHVLYAAEGSFANGNTLPAGIDVRGQRGYALAPGAVIDGRCYSLISAGDPAPCPSEIRARLRLQGERDRPVNHRQATDHPTDVAAFRRDCQAAPAAEPGKWHDLDVKLVTRAVQLGLSEATTIEIMREEFVPRGTGFNADGRADTWEADVSGAYRWAVREGLMCLDSVAATFESVELPPEQEARPPVRPARTFRLLSVADCIAGEPRDYIVKKLLSRGDFGLIVGAPGTGKSVLAPALAYAVAQNTEFMGMRVRGGPVIYVPGEDRHGMRKRVHALSLEHGDAPGFMLAPDITDLRTGKDQIQWLLQTVREKEPALVVLDTLAACFPGGNENSGDTDGMGAVLDVCRAITGIYGERPGPAVLLLHHPSKSDPTQPRGHTSLPADADVTLALQRETGGKVVNCSLGKNRNGPTYGLDLDFAVRSVTVGRDTDGEDVTAPVLRPVEAADRVRTTLPPQASRALEILAGLAAGPDAVGGSASFGLPFPVPAHGVSVARWKEACRLGGLSTGAPDADRKAFDRARDALVKAGRVAVVGLDALVPVGAFH